VREGQHAGELRTDLEATALAVVVMGTIQIAALSASRDRERRAAQAVRTGLITLLQPPGVRTVAGKKASHSTS